MKMKNVLLLCFTLSLSFACSVYLKADEATNLALLHENVTPSTMSLNNLRDFFATQDTSNTLKNRHSGVPNKTAHFNESFLEYIKQVYNQRTYSSFLSQNSTHIIEFLQIGRELNLDAEYLYVGTRLFYNKFKEAEIIDDSVALEILPAFIEHFAPHFDYEEEEITQRKENLDFLKKYTEEVILYKFTEHFTRFQTNPDEFISELSHDLAIFYNQQDYAKRHKQAKKENKREILLRLRQQTVRFFELIMSKVMWYNIQPETIWPSFLTIAQNLQGLGQQRIVDHMDDLDDLLWSLVHRFNYFIELTGSSLPLAFYEMIEHDLTNNKIFFLEAKEQDEGIASKKQILIEALIRGKARALAEQEGFITSPMY